MGEIFAVLWKYLPVIGSIASIIALPSAGVSWWQARKSKQSADKAQQLVSNIHTGDLSKFHSQLVETHKSVLKYASGNTQGADRLADVGIVQAFMVSLAENEGHFKDLKNDNPVVKLRTELQNIVERFRVGEKAEEQDAVLKDISPLLETFITISKTKTNNLIGLS